MKVNDLIYQKVEELEKTRRSKWRKGVCRYACMIVDKANEEPGRLLSIANVEDVCKCGAKDIKDASWGGCYLWSNEDIARILATPSELKLTHNGAYKPNKSEEWLDVQARALDQACIILKNIIWDIYKERWDVYEA